MPGLPAGIRACLDAAYPSHETYNLLSLLLSPDLTSNHPVANNPLRIPGRDLWVVVAPRHVRRLREWSADLRRRSSGTAENDLLLQPNKSSVKQEDVVDRAVYLAYARHGEDRHLLSQGFRPLGEEDGMSGGTTHGLASRYPNLLLNVLKSEPWSNLLSWIGEDAMLFLLMEVPAMVRAEPADVWTQLTGLPLHERLTPSNRCLWSSTGSHLESKAESTSNRRVRNKAFFSDHGLLHGGRGGLPASHPVNRLIRGTAAEPRETWRGVSRTQASRLALHIQSMGKRGRAGSPSNPKAPSKNKKKQRVRLSASLARVIPQCARLLERQRVCPYARLLTRALRSERDFETGKKNCGATSPEVASSFIKTALLRVIPGPLWGGLQRALLSSVDRLIRRHDLKLTSEDSERLARSSESKTYPDYPSRLAFIRFVLEDLTLSLAKAHFYVTEGETGRALWYTPASWHRVSRLNYRVLTSKNVLRRVRADKKTVLETFERRGYGPAAGRLLPKLRSSSTPGHSDARLILNFSHRAHGERSINQHLRPAFWVLKFASRGRTGYAVRSLSEIQRALTRHLSASSSCDARYMMSFDASKCFDSMSHVKTLEVVRDALRHREYALSLTTTTYADPGAGKIRSKHRYEVRVSTDAFKERESLVREESSSEESSRRTCLRFGRVSKWFVSRKRVFRLVRETVSETFVRDKETLWRLSRGVAQGSCLSTLLCDLYYGAFEKERMLPWVHPEQDLVMRFVDDYVFVTPSLERLGRMRELVASGDPSWGFRANPDKTRVVTSAQDPFLSWCGLKLDARALARVGHSFEKVFSARGSLLGAGGVVLAHRSAEARVVELVRSMRLGFLVRCHPVWLSLDFNRSLTTTCVNFSQSLVICAARFDAWYREARALSGGLDPARLAHELARFFDFAWSATRKKTSSGGLTRSLARVCGALAFARFLSKRPMIYVDAGLLPWLDRALEEWRREMREEEARGELEWAAVLRETHEFVDRVAYHLRTTS